MRLAWSCAWRMLHELIPTVPRPVYYPPTILAHRLLDGIFKGDRQGSDCRTPTIKGAVRRACYVLFSHDAPSTQQHGYALPAGGRTGGLGEAGRGRIRLSGGAIARAAGRTAAFFAGHDFPEKGKVAGCRRGLRTKSPRRPGQRRSTIQSWPYPAPGRAAGGRGALFSR